jgi:cysteine desulfurase
MVHYLDHAASTPVRPAAIEAMTRQLTHGYGNPTGGHRLARAANRVLDEARETMASALGATPGEIIFTAGGTEADNLAVLGTLEARGGVALCSAIEHHAILDPVVHSGGVVVGVTPQGTLDLDRLSRALSPEVSVVSVMTANNETGIVQPLAEVAELMQRLAPRAVLHTDAVQAFPWMDLSRVGKVADLISVSAHKFGGPQGVGVLMVRAGLPLGPRLWGGGQERGRRSGTQNVAGIASMAVAAALTVADRAVEVRRIGAMRDRLIDGLLARVPGTIESGAGEAGRTNRTPNIAHVCFEGIESEALLFLLEKEDIMASAAASCSSGAMEPSHVLAAMGVGRELAAGSLRLSLGHSTIEADVDAALDAIPAAVRRLRERG